MKNSLLAFLALFLAQTGLACDICGSAGMAAALFPGSLNPESQLNAGYQYLGFTSRHLPSILQGQQGEERMSSEQFHLANLGIRYSFLSKWQAVAQVPYQSLHKLDQGVSTQKQGLADIQLGLARYFRFDSVGAITSWTWVAEYDLKLPTGQYDANALSEQVSRFMFPGTGSVDHFFRLSSQMTMENWMLSFGGVFRLNGMGQEALNWGNRAQAQGEFGRIFRTKKKHEFFVSAGYVLEQAQADFQNGQELPFSSYTLGQAKASMQWRKASLAAGASYFIPVNGSLAEGRVTMTNRFQFQVTYYPKFL